MLKRVIIRLARGKEFPAGSDKHGYDIVAPLTAEGRLDSAEWNDKRAACTVRRIWGDEEYREGHLIHRAGGAGGGTWFVDYDKRTRADDEAGYRLSTHRFAPGEYVSIADDDEKLHTFLVMQVKDA